MQNKVLHDAAKMNRQRRKVRAWHKVVSVLIAAVVFCTTYAMILPAITMNNNYVCGIEEHIHDEQCYTVEDGLVCELTDVDGHTHTEACYLSDEVLTCNAEEHIHDQTCLTVTTPTDVGIALLSDDEIYWQPVSSVDDASANYLIVPSSASGVAFGIRRSGNSYSGTAISVTLTELSEYPGYYTAAGVTDACRWTFTASGSAYTIKNVSYSSYGLNLSNNTYISTTLSNNTLTYTESSGTFTIEYNNYYLIYRNSSFSRSRSYSTNRPMVIYKEVTGLPGTGDGDSGTDEDDTVQENPDVKPEYADYIAVSDGKSGSTSLGNVNGAYRSDAATSQIEDLFAGVAADDGFVYTDKSVVYGDDDYDAFATYDANTFGVTLSALGQTYSLSEEFGIKMPLDVVFVLDTSGSMVSGRTSDGKSYAAAMVEALNQTMAKIYKLNSDNRVGVVCYSGQGHTLLELGQYTAPDNLFFPENDYTSNTATLTASDDIASLDGSTVTRGSFNKWYGTYTQSGIAKGAQLLMNADPVFNGTVTYTEDGEEFSVSYTARRRPVMILLSDGDPTYSTSEYNNVLNASKIYGNGQASSTTNNQGINGYYTILSAKYYKNAVGAHYDANASFYTVGLGISETATNDSSGQSITGDHYKRAVMNPTKNNIDALEATYSDDTNRAVTSQQLYKLLNNTYTGTTITLGSDTSTYTQYGVPHATSSQIPVIANPYADTGNSYSDGAYFQETMTANELASAFIEKIQLAASVPVYGFVLKANTDVTAIDNIGEGMELKSVPVLRYGGQNYQPSSTEETENGTVYRYSGTYVAEDGSGQQLDFSELTVEVTNTDGLQTLTFRIPDEALPVYSPRISSAGQNLFYYEALPIRCIYKVGLTQQAQSAVAALADTGGQCIFYTNRWQTDSDIASALLIPTDGNPYYTDGNYDKTARNKAEDLTTTLGYALSYSAQTEEGVQHLLGNNGVLTFTVSEVSATVQKEWDESVLSSLYHPVTVHLYLVREDDSSFTAVTDSTVTVTLSEESLWTATQKIALPADGYSYYLAEADAEDYYVVYKQGSETLEQRTILVDGSLVTAGRLDTTGGGVTVSVKNFKPALLPQTGGRGAQGVIIPGVALLAVSVGILLYKKKKTGSL